MTLRLGSSLLLVVAWLAGCAAVPPIENKLVDKNEERYFEVADRLTKLEGELARVRAELADRQKPAPLIVAAKKPAPAPPTEETTDALSALDDDTVADSKHESMHLYFSGLRLMEDGKHELAVNAFREFLQTSADHVYADRAQYQLAEAHFRNKEYSLAVTAANLVESRYPTSFQVPEAILKRGLSYAAIGEKEPARVAFRDLLTRFPAAPAARVASQKLGELGAGTTPPPLLQ